MKRGWRIQHLLGYGLFALAMCLIYSVSLAQSAPAASSSTKAAAPEKKAGFYGDPARKRGLELGYDHGLQAGKLDKDQNKKPNPQAHTSFQDPNKYYRYEFGSRASFVSGYKSGFVGGYQKALGKKVPLKVDGSGTVAGTVSSGEKKPKKSPPPPANPAADAL